MKFVFLPCFKSHMQTRMLVFVENLKTKLVELKVECAS